jgi:hypothetical protein
MTDIWASKSLVPTIHTYSTSPHPLNSFSHNTVQLQGDLPTPLTHNNTQQHTTTHHNTQQHTTTIHNSTRVHKTTNVPVVFMAWYVMILRGATSLLGALEGVGPENFDFFGPKWHSLRLCHFRAQKSLDFQGPPLPMPPVMMLHPSKSLRTAP